jgi:hypothetical protein
MWHLESERSLLWKSFRPAEDLQGRAEMPSTAPHWRTLTIWSGSFSGWSSGSDKDRSRPEVGARHYPTGGTTPRCSGKEFGFLRFEFLVCDCTLGFEVSQFGEFVGTTAA